ncbi:DUF2849 domain-containing protein [Afifella sp. IM 167]|uniref:DUF2849 domain-containing protein n=1 Tax=Afifella sp. IM 167 TaxID=2033586 RepID=UPI001CC9020F|nr:DUF2849 domain-containing protein [Afifella sp. IM 167]MBZ8134995.1 nitrite reductase [Afifella sp. IM 167]
MSAKLQYPKVLAANRLSDGEVVWLGHGGAWVEAIEEARLFQPQEADAAIEAGARAVAAGLVVDPDPIDVTTGPEGVVPVRLRERIRALGPTIRTDLGKQASRLPRAA